MSSRRQKLFSAAVLLGVTLIIAGGLATTHVLVVNPRLGRSARAWWAGAGYLGEEGVIRQKTSYDCGVVALQMLLRQKGIESPLEELRAQAGTSERGTTLLGLKSAATVHGLDARALRVSGSDLAQVPLPAIAFVDGDHYVVVSDRRSDGGIVVLDPARGKLLYDAASFSKRWGGELLVVVGARSSQL
jgi:ABC-type bacteriocin/lantibiotic exporter with double-glycine peptidase domain